MARITVAKATEVLEAFVATGDRRSWELWNSLPDGLSRPLVTRAMKRAMSDGHAARAVGRRLNDSYFDLFVAELRKHPRWPETIMTLSVPAERQRELLGELYRKLRLLINARGNARERVRDFARDERFVQIVGAMMAGADLGPVLRSRCIGVLLESGSPEALDAVLPSVEAALKTQGSALVDLRDRLRAITKPAPALKPLIDTVEHTASLWPGHREKASVMAAIGLKPRPKPPVLSWFAEGVRASTTVYLRVDVDFEIDPWFRVELTETLKGVSTRETLFDSRVTALNQLGLPVFTHLLELPEWYATVRAALGGAWQTSRLHAPTVKDRQLFTQWLK